MRRTTSRDEIADELALVRQLERPVPRRAGPAVRVEQRQVLNLGNRSAGPVDLRDPVGINLRPLATRQREMRVDEGRPRAGRRGEPTRVVPPSVPPLGYFAPSPLAPPPH